MVHLDCCPHNACARTRQYEYGIQSINVTENCDNDLMEVVGSFVTIVYHAKSYRRLDSSQ